MNEQPPYRAPDEAPEIKPFHSSDIEKFAHLMDRELRDNERRKPDWRKMTVSEINDEMTKHLAKLANAVMDRDTDRIQEHAADIGVIAMFLAYVTGALDAPAHPSTDPPERTTFSRGYEY